MERALALVESGRSLDESTLSLDGEGPVVRSDDAAVGDMIADEETSADDTLSLLERLGVERVANVVAEAIPTSHRGGERTISFLARALRSGMSVASANKGPLSHRDGRGGEEARDALRRLARENGAAYRHESAVMDGVPIFSLWESMPSATLISLRGCLNSTTTAIITRMEGDLDGDSTLGGGGGARRLGIVEKDEGLDVDGHDAAAKLRGLLVSCGGGGGRERV